MMRAATNYAIGYVTSYPCGACLIEPAMIVAWCQHCREANALIEVAGGGKIPPVFEFVFFCFCFFCADCRVSRAG